MIPDHLIDKAVHAAGENWVLTFEWEHDKLHAQVHAALEAVAADIWDRGHVCGYSDAQDTARGIRLGAHNPYKRNENV